MLSKDELRQLLQSRFKNDSCHKLNELPLPSVFKDIYKGALRIKEAIEKNEKVAIVGDYDVDGVISCVIVSEFFDDIGFDYKIKIPNRFKDGYGLNKEIVEQLDDVSLIITVDNGISAHEAAALCKEKGIELIITDHHMPPAILPEAFAIINPKQKDCSFPDIEICGAVVAWYLIACLKEVCKLKYDMSKFLELLAIAIIADMMELRDLNRILVRKGLENLNHTKRAAFKAIKEHFGKQNFEFDHLGFLIAPLINSAGRMNDASFSYELLHTKDYAKAKDLLEQIICFNNERKNEEKQLFDESLKMLKNDEKVLIVSGKEWHEGVLGIVASRLARHFNKPAFVFTECKSFAKGSARSVGKIDILKLIEQAKEWVLTYGGHKGAAGLSLKKEDLPAFKQHLNDLCSKIQASEFENTEELLGELDPSDVDFELLELLENFEPYGHKNPRPFFEFKKLKLISKKQMGQNHLKLIFSKGNKKLEALLFNFDEDLELERDFSFIASISKNAFRGLITPQLIISKIYEA